MKGEWRRVSRSSPCPVCDKPDWCLTAGPEGDPDAAICARIESDRQCGEAGWLHRLRDGDRHQVARRTARRVALDHGPRPDFAGLAESYRRCIDASQLRRFAASLGLQVGTLERFGVGWSPWHGAWAFPMQDGAGAVIGIHLRKPGGEKFCVRGSKLGLFVPGDLVGGAARLLIAEGLSDAATLAEMGFAAVGRPSCSAAIREAVDLVRRVKPTEVVIVADGDEPGRRGAGNLASVLVAYAGAVRVIASPAGVKDVREWHRRGATADDVRRAIEAAPARRLKVQARVRGE